MSDIEYCDCCGEQRGGGSDMDEDDGLCGSCRIVERRADEEPPKIESGHLIASSPIVTKPAAPSPPAASRMDRTLEKYERGELVPWDEAKERILASPLEDGASQEYDDALLTLKRAAIIDARLVRPTGRSTSALEVAALRWEVATRAIHGRAPLSPEIPNGYVEGERLFVGPSSTHDPVAESLRNAPRVTRPETEARAARRALADREIAEGRFADPRDARIATLEAELREAATQRDQLAEVNRVQIADLEHANEMGVDALDMLEMEQLEAAECSESSLVSARDLTIRDLRAQLAARDALLAEADAWILSQRTPIPRADYACVECVPRGEIVVPEFRCVPHAARARDLVRRAGGKA